MRNQPARRKTDSVRRVNGKLQWRVYGLGWVSSGTMAVLVAITVILLTLILFGL